MSTAVYLATNLYLHRLAVIERVVPVTARNVHRLVLAGLRVAMKVFEDLSWPHRRFAKVGGVGERELGRLEVGFCFLMGWRLGVGGGVGGVGEVRGREGGEGGEGEGGEGVGWEGEAKGDGESEKPERCERESEGRALVEGVGDGWKAEADARCNLSSQPVAVPTS